MNIRGKLTAGMCVLLGALCVGVLATVHLLLLPQVEELERQSLQLDLERSHQTLMQEQKRLLSIAADWAQWDETYQFVQDRNQDYVASNLIDDFLIPLQADFLVILDQNGDAIANLHSDKLGAPELTAIAQGAEGITAPLAHMGQAGEPSTALLQTGAGVFMVAGQPVTDSYRVEPAKGMLYFGRLVDPPFIDSLAEQLRLPLSASLVSGEASGSRIRFLSSHQAIADLPLTIANAPDQVLLLSLSSERPFYRKGVEGALYTEAVIILIGLVAALAAYVFFKLTLVSPIIELQRVAESLGQGESPDDLAFVSRRDELGKLARTFHRMVENIEENQRVLRGERNQFLNVSLTDPLTGLRNRRYLERHLGNPDSWLMGQSYLFMIIDIDFFKQVNDVHGHDVGDVVIRQFAETLSECCRSNDVVVRFGGEEFAILCLDCDTQAGELLAERIVQSVSQRRYGPPSAGLAISCSIGFYVVAADRVREPVNEWPEMLKVADLALYTVKRNGRDNWIGLDWCGTAGWARHPQSAVDIQAGLARDTLRLVTGGFGEELPRWDGQAAPGR